MAKEEILQELVAFFIEGFNENKRDVRAWLEEGDLDADEFVKEVQRMAHEGVMS
jgi:hypothetical protein